MTLIKQYQVVIVNLDPTIGHEIQKTRPCVVISPDEMNKNLGTITIAPITSASKPYPTRVKIILDEQECRAVLDQIRTVDQRRITKTIGSLTAAEIAQIKDTIKRAFVD